MRTIDNNSVAIMLAAYNGEKYIKEQIDSITKQTYENWILFVRDDGSNDRTVEIIKEYKQNHDNIVLLEGLVGGGSANANFAVIWRHIKEYYDFSYYMFCDQDDYWIENKIEISMKKMLETEGSNLPCLVHTDLKVVNEELQVLGDSFAAYRALNMSVQDLNHLLVQNNITGCTMLWNRALNQILDLQHKDVAMHDWWIAVVTSAFGKISFVEEPTILYRQHGDNVVGATRVNTLGFIIKRLTGSVHVKETLMMSQNQALAILTTYQDKLSGEQKDILSRFAFLRNKNKISRVLTILKYGFLKQGKVQIIGEIMFI